LITPESNPKMLSFQILTIEEIAADSFKTASSATSLINPAVPK
jgi:hypothetical protein